MKCTLLEIQNFLSVGYAKLSLADKGLVAICGINNDDTSAGSNGAGKSSIADALAWNITGETARDGLSADEIVNNKAKKDCQVTTEWLEDDGGKYTICRWRKKSSAVKKNGVSLTYTSADGVTTDLTGGTDKITQAEIDKALGCTKEVFNAAVYAGQEKMPNLPGMTDGELKQLIEKASGVDVLNAAYAIARQKLKDAENDHDKWRADHVRAERDISEVQARFEELIKRRDVFQSQKKADLDVLSTQLKETVERARTHQRERDYIIVDNVQSKIDKLDGLINAVHEENDKEAKLLDLARSIEAFKVKAEAVYQRAVEDARAQKARLDNITSQVGKPCSECGKPYEAHDIEGAAKIAKEKTVDLAIRAKEPKTDVLLHETSLADAQNKLAEHRASKTDIRTTVEERRRLADVLAQRRRSEDALKTETESATRTRAQIDKLKGSTNPFIELVETSDREREEAVKAYHASEETGIQCEKRVMICKEVVKVYGPAGVRAHILDNVTPFLNERTATYLGAMTDGNMNAVWSTLSLSAKGDLTEKFAIAVTKDGAGSSFAAMSGGEKRKVRLACALALQDLVASRATKPIELAVFDEVDSALDVDGLERLMNLFETKGRERGTIIIISHSDISDWVRQVATVTRDGGVSTISGILEAA